MKYAVTLTWNEEDVLDGTISAVMLWENLRIIAQQFGNAAKAGFEPPTLVDLANAPKGTVFEGFADDGTGRFEFWAEARK